MWFRPKRWGKWVAVYVPTSWQGWTVIAVLMAATGLWLYVLIGRAGLTAPRDMVAVIAPWIFMSLATYDVLCFRFGEYPSWWGHKKRFRFLVALLFILFVISSIMYLGGGSTVLTWALIFSPFAFFGSFLFYTHDNIYVRAIAVIISVVSFFLSLIFLATMTGNVIGGGPG